MDFLKGRRIILASTSKRRVDILTQLGLEFETASPLYDEDNGPLTGSWTQRAYSKALSLKDRYEGSLILGADTVVVLKDKIFGKPSDELEAREMLSQLGGRAHEVITGIAIIDSSTGYAVEKFENTKVYFGDTIPLIDWYISTGEYAQKAGAYGIQGKGALFVKRIEGCYFNVVGLPVYAMMECFRKILQIKENIK